MSPEPQVLHQSLCFTPFLSASTCNFPHNFLSLLLTRHILLIFPPVAHISASFWSTGFSPLGSLHSLSNPPLILAPVPNFMVFSYSPFPEASSCGWVLLFIAVPWSRSRPLPHHAWVLLLLSFSQVGFSSCWSQKWPLFILPRPGPGSFYSYNIRNSPSPQHNTHSLHGQELRNFRY